MNNITLSFVGDICITNEYNRGPNFTISKHLSKIFNSSDLVVGNLECPITNSNNILEKNGPNLKSDYFLVEAIKEMNFGLVTLANNHILDYSIEGLEDTLTACKEYSIDTTGAGITLEDSQKPYIFEKKGVKIGVLNVAEGEFSRADEALGGANPYSIIGVYNKLQSLRNECDKIILVIHGGIENFDLPSIQQVDEFRFFADNGADMIICHHSHRVSGHEIYNGVPIFYGLGNFVFPAENKHFDWYIGMILNVSISNMQLDFSLIPVRYEKDKNRLVKLEGRELNEFNKKEEKLSRILKDKKDLEAELVKFVKKQSNFYLQILFNHNTRIERILISRFGLKSKFFRNDHRLNLRNFFECDAHGYLIKKILRQKI